MVEKYFIGYKETLELKIKVEMNYSFGSSDGGFVHNDAADAWKDFYNKAEIETKRIEKRLHKELKEIIVYCNKNKLYFEDFCRFLINKGK